MLHQRLFPSEEKSEADHSSHKKTKNKKDVMKVVDTKKEIKSTEESEYIIVDCKQ